MQHGKKKTNRVTGKKSCPPAVPEMLEPRRLLSGGGWGGPQQDHSNGHSSGDNRGDVFAARQISSDFASLPTGGDSGAHFASNVDTSWGGLSSGQLRGNSGRQGDAALAAASSWVTTNLAPDSSSGGTDSATVFGRVHNFQVSTTPAENFDLYATDHGGGGAYQASDSWNDSSRGENASASSAPSLSVVPVTESSDGPSQIVAAPAISVTVTTWSFGPTRGFYAGDASSVGVETIVHIASGSYIPTPPAGESLSGRGFMNGIALGSSRTAEDSESVAAGATPAIVIVAADSTSSASRDSQGDAPAGIHPSDQYAMGWGHDAGAIQTAEIDPAYQTAPSAPIAPHDTVVTSQQTSAPSSSIVPAFRAVSTNASNSEGASVSPAFTLPSAGSLPATPSAAGSTFGSLSVRRESNGIAIASNTLLIVGNATLPHIDASYAAPAARWIDQSTSSLMSWLGGAKPDAPAIAGQGVADSADAVAAGATASAPQAIVHVANAAMSTLAGPVLNAPANLIYRFASFDPARTFADAMAAFAGESASMMPVESPSHSSHRAWIVTGLVIGADVLLAARWYAQQSRLRRKSAKGSSQSHGTAPVPAGV